MPKISVIIPCRDEADTLWFTLNSIQMHTRGLKVEEDGLEIIVADNDPGAKTCGKTVKEVCEGFGSVGRFPVRYVAAGEIQSPYYPRTKGAAAAHGEHLIFLDAHVLLSPFAISAMHSAYLSQQEVVPAAFVKHPEIYLAHIPVAFDRSNRLFGPYKLRLHGDFWGGWRPMPEMPPASTLERYGAYHPIGASGIWCISTSMHSWTRVQGFNPNFRGYGGGEVYLQLKHWLLGGHVFLLRHTEEFGGPVHGVHWSAPRRYQARWQERLRNVMLSVSVVAPDVLSEVKENLRTKANFPIQQMDDLTELGRQAGAEEAEWLARRRVIGTTEELEQFWKVNQVFF